MNGNQLFADVIVPLAIPGYFTYKVPDTLKDKIQPGVRVVVQFGKRKLYTAILANIHSNTPAFESKEIIQVIDNSPIINNIQISFWNWLAMYYMCTPGEVMKAALPSGLKLESESVLLPGTSFSDTENLNGEEIIIIELLKKKGSVTINEVINTLQKRNVYSVLGYLSSRKIITIEESITERYIPKFEEFVELDRSITDEKQFTEIYESILKAPRQADLLLIFAGLGRPFSANPVPVKKSELISKNPAYANALRTLYKKGILKITEKEVSRLSDSAQVNNVNIVLTATQSEALTKIKELFTQKDITLLHGVTSSGKTEIYIRLMQEYLQKGKQVLYLLPEIALTSQIINRLRKVFGDKAGVYHSKFNDSERVETYLNVLEQSPCKKKFEIILGVRSSVFLPFSDLGLIIIDEEHENTYKQQDPAPRYHARDSALMLAKMHGAKVLLGTATPSLESYWHALQGKYGLVELNQRFMEMKMPEIQVVNTKEAARKKQMVSDFSEILIENIKKTIENKKQVILFQNRRGYAPRLECDDCSFVPGCPHCDVKLTYHKYENRIICHYCGYSTGLLTKCPACKGNNILMKGTGTEKIEDELAVIFPGYRTGRMDLDTARTRRKIDEIFSEFENGNIKILVGTQMVSKGLDFDNVGLVGIINADNLLNYPDFRANERSFQMMLQVSGRAGRKSEQGKVFIQTTQPSHPVIDFVINNDFKSSYNWLINDRKKYGYPPFTRIIELTLKHRQPLIVENASVYLANLLRKIFKEKLLGPEKPLVAKIQTLYLRKIMLKTDRNSSLIKIREIIVNEINKVKAVKEYKGVVIVTDVDPM